MWFHCNSNQNLSIFLKEIDRLILKLLWKCKGSRIAKTEEQQSWTCTPDFKTFYKATVIKIIRCYGYMTIFKGSME